MDGQAMKIERHVYLQILANFGKESQLEMNETTTKTTNREKDESFKKLKDLNLSQDEMSNLKNAFKSKEFCKLFAQYAQELESPENRELYENEIIELEKERGHANVKFIHPSPQYVVKTITEDRNKTKWFINIGTCKEVAEAKFCREKMVWNIPHSMCPKRDCVDHVQRESVAVDVVFHPKTIELGGKLRQMKQAIESVAVEVVEKTYNVKLSRNLKYPKMKCKGVMKACVVRNVSVDEFAKQLKGEEENENMRKFMEKKLNLEGTKKESIEKKKIIIKEEKKLEKQTPKYQVIHCYEDWGKLDAPIVPGTEKSNIRGNEATSLKIVMDLPLYSLDDVELDVFENSVKVETKDGKFELQKEFKRFRFNIDEATAEFKSASYQLTVRLPILEHIKPKITIDREEKNNEKVNDIEKKCDLPSEFQFKGIEVIEEIQHNDLKVNETDKNGWCNLESNLTEISTLHHMSPHLTVEEKSAERGEVTNDSHDPKKTVNILEELKNVENLSNELEKTENILELSEKTENIVELSKITENNLELSEKTENILELSEKIENNLEESTNEFQMKEEDDVINNMKEDGIKSDQSMVKEEVDEMTNLNKKDNQVGKLHEGEEENVQESTNIPEEVEQPNVLRFVRRGSTSTSDDAEKRNGKNGELKNKNMKNRRKRTKKQIKLDKKMRENQRKNKQEILRKNNQNKFNDDISLLGRTNSLSERISQSEHSTKFHLSKSFSSFPCEEKKQLKGILKSSGRSYSLNDVQDDEGESDKVTDSVTSIDKLDDFDDVSFKSCHQTKHVRFSNRIQSAVFKPGTSVISLLDRNPDLKRQRRLSLESISADEILEFDEQDNPVTMTTLKNRARRQRKKRNHERKIGSYSQSSESVEDTDNSISDKNDDNSLPSTDLVDGKISDNFPTSKIEEREGKMMEQTEIDGENLPKKMNLVKLQTTKLEIFTELD
ncbi:hypothetical protein SNEBB_006910 [Seison nebaliae]|nr:hypothetical protein SNEBB_006910 [Seison nebaliae]